MIKKIVIIGPESAGKSTLCEELAAHYKTNWVPEYARQYLEKNGMDYNFEDLFEIAKGQVEGEESAVDNCESLVFSHKSLSPASHISQPLFIGVLPSMVILVHRYEAFTTENTTICQRIMLVPGAHTYKYMEQQKNCD